MIRFTVSPERVREDNPHFGRVVLVGTVKKCAPEIIGDALFTHVCTVESRDAEGCPCVADYCYNSADGQWYLGAN